ELPTLLCHVLSPPFWTSILWGPLSENLGAPQTPERQDTSDGDCEVEDRSERRDVEMVHLWDPKAGVLPAGVNYGSGDV
ncbi:hypothetical protein ABZV29_39245, partial [Streptomyces sp. NPDC005236]